jgi:hypothetical protein
LPAKQNARQTPGVFTDPATSRLKPGAMPSTGLLQLPDEIDFRPHLLCFAVFGTRLELTLAQCLQRCFVQTLEPLLLSTRDSDTLPSVPTRKPMVTVPVSSFISAAFGYFGGSQDLLSITGDVSAAITAPAETSNKAESMEESIGFMIQFFSLAINQVRKDLQLRTLPSHHLPAPFLLPALLLAETLQYPPLLSGEQLVQHGVSRLQQMAPVCGSDDQHHPV